MGFSCRDDAGDLIIPKDQPQRILNVDEFLISMDGSKYRRGGRPSAVFHSPNLPLSGRPNGKSGITTTLITGSTAAGEVIPPHLQFSTKAKTTDKMRLRDELVKYYPNIHGKLGCEEVRIWPVSFGMNTKGETEDREFELYLLNTIFPLFPDSKDQKENRVLLKVESGPGRLNAQILCKCRLLGFILYPGVPNTMAVS